MLKQRIITALWGIPLILAVVWFGHPWFAALTAVWGMLAAREFYKIIADAKVPPLAYFGMLWVALFILTPYLTSLFQVDFLVPILLTTAVVLPLIWLVVHPGKENSFARWAWTIAGILYVGWLMSYLVALRSVENGRDWVLLALLVTFASDTAAFFIGRRWGKHRLAPLISPKKTWEGAIGGVFFAIVAGVVLSSLLHLPLNYGLAVLLGFLVSVAGQLGDLAESLLKRNMNIKDSSKLIPGHGGVLDRMDSIVFAGVVVYYFAILTTG